MADILDVVQTIAQVAQANAHYGATDAEGKPIKVGLRREEEMTIHDPRLVDGFKVKFSGDKMILTYQAEVLIQEVHEPGFEGEVKQTLSDILSYIKKEYKKIANKALTISRDGDPDIQVQNISRIRTILTATQVFNLKGTEADSVSAEESSNDKLKKAMKSFLAFGKEEFPGVEKPKNVTRKD